MRTPLVRMAGHFAPTLSDRELLARFVNDRDEVAFAALVHRHGPAVYGVCRRILGNSADVEDAFQAVFLVLVNRADAVTHRPALGGWLHEVAVRVAMKARTTLARLRKHERRAAEARAESVFDPPPHDLPVWLDREVAALPERLREPIVRCLIQDRPRIEVAAELGIPEGTLASRLDTARKRLADRLARHRIPLALGGLLVPVPATLTAATVGRATDGAGVVIHQLASEVTRMMVSKPKWVALIAVSVPSAAVGGLLLAAAVVAAPLARHSMPEPMSRAPIRTPMNAPVPEPAWQRDFNKVYRLSVGQYVKRVSPPYIKERIDFKLHALYEGRPIDPAVDQRNRESSAEDSLFTTLFVEQDGARLKMRFSLSSVYLKSFPEKRQGDNLLTAVEVISSITGLEPPEYVMDPGSKDEPLFAEGNKSVHGDFVTRKDAPIEKLVPQLEKILRDECKLDIRLTLKEEEQPVFVVGGTFKPNPPAWRPKKELDLYATEAGLNKEHDHFHPNENPKTEKFETVKSSQYSGTPVDFVRFVGSRLGTRMVWDAPLSAEPKVNWINHTVRNPSPKEEAADHDPAKVLKVVAEQTGLTFKMERRKVSVLYLGTSKKR